MSALIDPALINDELFAIEEDDFGEYLEIEWTPPQSKFLQATCTYPLFVGGFGSGKTTTMAGSMFEDMISFPGCDIAGYAPTYDLLNLVTIPTLLDFIEASGLEYDWNKSRYTIKVEDHGKFILRSLDNPKRIVGYKVLRSHIDELDTLSREKAQEAWNKVIARNRQKVKIPGTDQYAKNRVSAYTTPEGYVFCYDRWVKNKKPEYELFKAPTRSNPHLPDDYEDNLRATYDEALVEAYLEGEFVNLTSTSVYKSFNRNLNATKISKPRGGEHIHVGMDFNVDRGAAVIHVVRDGIGYAIDEIHNAHDTQEQIEVLEERFPNNPVHVYPDATGRKRSSSNSAPTKTDIAQLEAAGFVLHYDFTNPLVRDRVNCVNAMILNGDGERRYFVNIDKCPNTVETMERQVWGDNGLPDKEAGLDHIGDALGYFICKMFPIKRITVGYGR